MMIDCYWWLLIMVDWFLFMIVSVVCIKADESTFFFSGDI